MTEYDVEKLTPEIVAGWKSSLYDINHRFVKLACIDDGKHIRRLVDLGFDINHRDINGETPLFSLANASEQLVCEMLKNGAEINVFNRFGQSPLFFCVQRDNPQNIRLLLEAGADVNRREDNGWTPLMEAVSSAAFQAAEVLLEAGADFDAKGKKEETALFMAAQRLAYGFSRKEKEEAVWKILELLLQKGADVNSCDILGNTPFMAAVRADNVRLAEMLKNYGAEVNAVDCYGMSALMTACQNPRGELGARRFCIEKLLSWGADVSLRDDDGRTAGDYLANNPLLKNNAADFDGRLECGMAPFDVRQILEHLTKEQVSDWKAKLHNINRRFVNLARVDGGKYLDKLLACGFDINHRDCLGNTPLALLSNDALLTEKFIAAGADARGLNKYGKTVLWDALYDKTTERLELLLKYAADLVAVQDENGRTLFHLAAERANLPAVKLFLEAGTKVDIRNGSGKTPLQAAVCRNENNPGLDGDIAETVRFLLDNGADVNAADDKGQNAVFDAALFANVRLLKLLLEYGADVNRRDAWGRTALMLAASIHFDKERREEFVRILLNAGADVAAADDDGITATFIMQKNPLFKDSLLLQGRQ